MSTMTATKVTSATSSSGAPSPPAPTPRTDASNNIDSPPNTDFEAVGNILGPIQEDLNESADAALYPSPPINTPVVLSPAPSVYNKGGRGRGMSAIGDRLAQLKLEERSSPRKDTDVTSSNRSVVASIEEEEGEDDEDDASSIGIYAAKTLTSLVTAAPSMSLTPVSVPVALGSPSTNPRIEEYLNFTSNDLPVSDPNKQGSSSTKVAPGNEGHHSRDQSIKSRGSDATEVGVTEKSTWAEEVEDAAKRAIMQLEQLALDESKVNPNRTIEGHFIARLERLLSSAQRDVKVTLQKKIQAEP